MSDQELDRLQALADGATPGPWTAETWHTTDTNRSYAGGPRVLFQMDGEPDANVGGILFIANGNTKFSQDDANCAFIAACREAVPGLIALAREALELRLVVHDLLQDGYERGNTGKYKRALEQIATSHASGSFGHHAPPGNGPQKIAQEALREEGDDE